MTGDVKSHGKGAGKGDCPLCDIFVISQWHWRGLEEENVGDSELLDVNVRSFSSHAVAANTIFLPLR